MTARDSRGRFVSGSGSSGAVRIVDRDHGYSDLRARIFGAANPKISVGILEADGGEPAKGSTDDDPLTILEVAIINEFGSEDGKHPPSRSFLRAWFDEAREDISARLQIEMQAVVTGKRTKAQALERVGLWAVGEIQKRIAQGIDPANADSTVARKGSSTPLIDTGQLRSSISYKVEAG